MFYFLHLLKAGDEILVFSHNVLPSLLLIHLQPGWRIILQFNCTTQIYEFPRYTRFPAQLWANQTSHSAPAKQGDYSHPSQWCQQRYRSLLHAVRSFHLCRIAMATTLSTSLQTPNRYNLHVVPRQSRERKRAFREAPLRPSVSVFLITIYGRTWGNYTPVLSPSVTYLSKDCFLNIPTYCNS